VDLTLILINNSSIISSCQQWIKCVVNVHLPQVQPDLLAEMHVNYFRVFLGQLFLCRMMLGEIMSLVLVHK